MRQPSSPPTRKWTAPWGVKRWWQRRVGLFATMGMFVGLYLTTVLVSWLVAGSFEPTPIKSRGNGAAPRARIAPREGARPRTGEVFAKAMGPSLRLVYDALSVGAPHSTRAVAVSSSGGSAPSEVPHPLEEEFDMEFHVAWLE